MKIFLLALSVSISTTLFAQVKDTLISVGQHSLNFRIIQGIGRPIVFESGAGNDGSVWKDIMLLLAKRTKAPLIAYDRAGFGKSGINTAYIKIENEVNDLSSALAQLGYDTDYFFVAHSLGSSYAMKFAQDKPNKVAGSVFIDVVNPYYLTAEKARHIKNQFIDSLETIKKESIGFYYLILNYEDTGNVMRQSAQAYKTPTTVIASGLTPFEGDERCKFIAGLKKFAEEHDNRNYILLKDAEHFVFYDEPEFVTDEIISLYKTVKDTNR